VVKLT